MMYSIKKIFNQYNNISLPIKASIWFIICSCIQKGIAVITVPIFTRLLTTNQYGLYSVYQSWCGIIGIFATLNLYAGVFNNGMLKYKKDKDGFQSSLLTLSLTITILLAIIYLMTQGFWNNIFKLSTPLVMAMFIDCFFSVGISFWSAKQRFEYKYKALVLITIGSSIIAPMLGIIGVLLTTTYKTEARIFSFIFTNIIFGGILGTIILVKGKKFYVKQYWKFALAFNIPLIPHYLSQTILNQADRIMISRMVSDEKAAIYSVAYSAAMLMTIFSQSINNSFIPWTYKALEDKKYDELRQVSKMLIVLIAGISFVVILFAPELISILASKEYSEAVKIIPPVAGSVFFMFVYPLFGNVEFYLENTKFIMIASSIAALINIILNYFFIPIYGYEAAGYTTLICYILLCIVHYIFMKKLCLKNGISLRIYDIKFIIKFSSTYIILIMFVSFIYKYILIRYIIITILVLLTIIKREKLIDIIKRLKRK